MNLLRLLGLSKKRMKKIKINDSHIYSEGDYSFHIVEDETVKVKEKKSTWTEFKKNYKFVNYPHILIITISAVVLFGLINFQDIATSLKLSEIKGEKIFTLGDFSCDFNYTDKNEKEILKIATVEPTNYNLFNLSNIAMTSFDFGVLSKYDYPINLYKDLSKGLRVNLNYHKEYIVAHKHILNLSKNDIKDLTIKDLALRYYCSRIQYLNYAEQNTIHPLVKDSKNSQIEIYNRIAQEPRITDLTKIFTGEENQKLVGWFNKNHLEIQALYFDLSANKLI